VEINSHPQRLDLDAPALRFGLARGMKTSVNPDAHTVEGLSDVDYGVGIARKGWCTPDDVMNAWPLERFLAHLAARRRDAGAGAVSVAVPASGPSETAPRSRRRGAANPPARGKGRKGRGHAEKT
jgi:hypothetical protein